MILKSKMYETTKNNQGNQVDQKNQGSDNLPRVRFPEFKDEWEHKRLSEFLSESKKRNGDLKYDKDSLASSPIFVLHSSEQFPSTLWDGRFIHCTYSRTLASSRAFQNSKPSSERCFIASKGSYSIAFKLLIRSGFTGLKVGRILNSTNIKYFLASYSPKKSPQLIHPLFLNFLSGLHVSLLSSR